MHSTISVRKCTALTGKKLEYVNDERMVTPITYKPGGHAVRSLPRLAHMQQYGHSPDRHTRSRTVPPSTATSVPKPGASMTAVVLELGTYARPGVSVVAQEAARLANAAAAAADSCTRLNASLS